jgi:hypothetical protein
MIKANPIKQETILEANRDDRIYRLHLPQGAELGEIHDILFEMRIFIAEQIDNRIQQEQLPEVFDGSKQ